LRKSPPVPLVMKAKTASGAMEPSASKKPLTASLMVPSPPMAFAQSLAHELRCVAALARHGDAEFGIGRAQRCLDDGPVAFGTTAGRARIDDGETGHAPSPVA
jgi:hypothetical protein